MADIPPEVLADLNAGRAETITLVEWLAVDPEVLLRNVFGDLGHAAAGEALAARAAALRAEGVALRARSVGRLLHDHLGGRTLGDRLWEALAGHRSDVVRSWAAYAVAADPSLTLPERLAAVRPFAADGHMGVRETAWDCLRPYLAADLQAGLAALTPWVEDPDPNIRRCATEATRPRGVWCTHFEPLKRDPEPGRVLLEPVRSDPSDYVRRSVGNWLNDASKTRPDWVVALCARWERESPTPETAWTVRHGLRTLRKAGAR